MYRHILFGMLRDPTNWPANTGSDSQVPAAHSPTKRPHPCLYNALSTCICRCNSNLSSKVQCFLFSFRKTCPRIPSLLHHVFFSRSQRVLYGNMQPTWITRRPAELHFPFTRHMVPAVEFWVPQCCATDCEINIRKHLRNIPGVNNVIVDYYNQKVTVTGNVSETKLLKEMKKVKKRARLYIRKQGGQL